MATIQKRIPELLTYSQLASSDVDYIDPANIWMAVDKNGWTEPKKMSLINFLSNNHVETSTLTPSSTSFSATYNESFLSSNYFFYLKVYKVITIPNVGEVEQTVKYHDLTKTTNGFSFTLDSYEAGIIVTYFASESGITAALSKDYVYATGSVSSLVVPSIGKVQITGLTNSINQGITLASNEFTIGRSGIYSVDISFSSLNETLSNALSIDVYNDTPTALGITRQFVPRADYDNHGVSGMLSLLSGDKIRFYLSAPSTGLTLDLSTITINIKQL